MVPELPTGLRTVYTPGMTFRKVPGAHVFSDLNNIW